MRGYEIRDYRRFSDDAEDASGEAEVGGVTRLVQRFIMVIMLTICLMIMAACVHVLSQDLRPLLQQSICNVPLKQT